jgi:predicted ribosome quality control (RQC) complex YloA/Tae2 family protein
MGPELIKNVVKELDELLRSGIIKKVFQPGARGVYLMGFVRGRQELFLVSTHPKFSRIHLAKTRPESPPTPKRFCAFLRSRITNARIEEITQVEGERIVRIGLKKGPESFTLIAELTGKSSNIILLDEKGTVLDALRYFPLEGSVRAVVPGICLEPLPPIREAVGEKKEPVVPKEEGLSWNETAELYYSALIQREERDREQYRLRRSIKEVEKRLTRKLENLLGDKKKSEGNLYKSRLGEFLVANFGKLKRGTARIKIPLDRRLGPKENVDGYFKRARKAKTSLKLLKTRIPAVEAELEYIKGLFYEWEAIEGDEDMEGLMEALFEELIEAGYLKRKTLTLRKEPVVAEPVRRQTSSEGLEILSGKSGPGNDLLVKKYAKEGDLWFHAKGLPGSHVLLKAGRRGPTDRAIEEAAGVAAYYSKGRTSTKVEVIYTDVKNVKKPKGAKPGMVTVKKYNAIVVRPVEVKQ